MYQPLFEDISTDSQSNPAILLVDASGSTTHNKCGDVKILEKMRDIAKTIPNENFRIIFWNSDEVSQNTQFNNFPNGIFKWPYVAKKTDLDAIFAIVQTKISGSSLTFPHLGFDNIPTEWINNTDPTHIYFFTDGQIGYGNCPTYHLHTLKNKLKESITKNLFNKYNNIHLHLISVENTLFDGNNVESLNVASGGDVFKIIRDNGLTKYLTEFVHYAPNLPNGFKHINTIIPPKGYIPFNDKCFSESRTNDFILYLKNHIDTIKDNQNELIKIIQSLSTTIRTLIQDKPKVRCDQLIQLFCDMFNDTAIDPLIIKFMLSDSISLENQGKAIVFSEYRAKMRNLFQQAQNFLLQDTKKSVGIESTFITLPIDDKIIVGSSNIVTEKLELGNGTYPNSSVKIGSVTFPVLPLFNKKYSNIIEQCIRQYVRSIIGKQYNLNYQTDDVMYLVLGLVLRIVMSNVDETYKNSFRILGHIMLQKKRLNCDVTELSNLEEGNLPMPNSGEFEKFHKIMFNVGTILNINCSPLTLWFAICLSLNNETLISKQLIHCFKSIQTDYPDLHPRDLIDKLKTTVTPVSVLEIPVESMLDYSCLVSLDDTSLTGGYKINSHTSLTGALCSPMCVFSKTGHELLLKSNPLLCPICYQTLTVDSFTEVGKKVILENIFSSEFVNPFMQPKYVAQQKPTYVPSTSSSYVSQASGSQSSVSYDGNSKGVIVKMRGTVGSGKSTFAEKLKTVIENAGGNCICEGTDKYCKNGVSLQVACDRVTTELRKAKSVTNKLNVIIIDTCGDYQSRNKDEIFNVNFSGWKIITVEPNYERTKIDKYLAWTLRNVLQRQKPSHSSNYWLNPITAGLSTCLSVHNKKARTLFGNKNVKCVTNAITITNALQEINLDAEEYQEYLNNHMSLDNQVQTCFEKIQKAINYL